MTAFARENSNTARDVLTIELRTVNHRYLDCSFKLPDSIRALEPRLREGQRPPDPLEQGDAKIGFQCRDLTAERQLGLAVRPGGGGQRALLRGGEEGCVDGFGRDGEYEAICYLADAWQSVSDVR